MSDVYVTDSNNTTYTVQDGDLLLPLNGNWSAQLSFGGIDSVPTGQVQLTWYDTTYHGYVIRSGIQNVQGTAVLAGGSGGLWKQNPSKMYDNNVSASLPLQEILSAVNEQISPDADSDFLEKRLQNWIRRAESAGQQLVDLTTELGCYWTVAPDGGIYVGNYTWSAADDSLYTVQKHDPTLQFSWFNTLSTTIRPGQMITVYGTDYHIAAVHYELSGTGTVVQMWYLDPRVLTSVLDPIREGLRQFVQETMARTNYHVVLSGKVVVQHEDGSLDIMMDSEEFPPLTNVPLRYPWPRAKINVSNNDRVLVAFENGDPVQYSAQLYGNGQGGKPIARKGDSVDCGTLTLTAVGVMGTFTYVDPNGNTSTLGSITLPIPAAGTPGMITGGSVSVSGLINQGSSVIEDS